MQLTKVAGDKVALGPADPSVLMLLKAGDTVEVDNSNFLAVQTYHRHQVPEKEYHVWDQFRDSAGKPVYPQRPMLLGAIIYDGASGVLPAGKFKGKMIVLSLLCGIGKPFHGRQIGIAQKCRNIWATTAIITSGFGIPIMHSTAIKPNRKIRRTQ